MASEPQITFDNVLKTYVSDFRRKKNPALVGLTLQVFEGEVFGIVGPNGAGKSTALKILLGLLKQDTGTVSLAGLDPADPLAHHALGYLPENPCLYEHLTVNDHLMFAARIHNLPLGQAKQRISHLIEKVGLAHAAKTPIRRFSKGMTQRAALAYAVFHQPRILILDEPMSGLDPLGRRLVVDIIEEYNRQGRTVLFCSHILTDVERICHRIGIMNKGRLAMILSPDELAKGKADIGRGDATPLETLFVKIVQANAF